MLILFAFAQLALAQGPADSIYSSPALRAMVAAAASANHEPPPELRGYRSHIETESSLLLRDTLGREHTAEVEQFATQATWEREGRYQLHIVGYRSQSVGVPYSTLSIVRAWTVPSLYGERLSLGAYLARGRESDSLIAVHPFAADRDNYYEFSDGDTVAVLRVGTRRIPIARIRVHPRLRGRTGLAVFDGEIDIDAQRMQIIRMRGQFVVVEQRPARAALLARLAGLVPVAYIEFVNAEIGGKYWLPAFQRTEFQASIAILGQTRPVFRIVSTISDIVVRDTGAASDSIVGQRIAIDWAPSDTLNSYSAWNQDLGVQSGSVHADDFIDMAPDAWRLDGPPRIEPFPNSAARLFRFNRVEGLYLGLAPSVEFRSMAPGVSAGVYGGWAFTEQTARGGIYATDQTRQLHHDGSRGTLACFDQRLHDSIRRRPRAWRAALVDRRLRLCRPALGHPFVDASPGFGRTKAWRPFSLARAMTALSALAWRRPPAGCDGVSSESRRRQRFVCPANRGARTSPECYR